MDTQFTHYDHLGFINPFYFRKDGVICSSESFRGMHSQKETNSVIDPTSVMELLNCSHTFGDRTMVADVSMSPWMSKPNNDITDWSYVSSLPQHGNLLLSEHDAATGLFSRLLDEVETYIGNKKRVGLLLSGGMDSRILATVIKHLQLAGRCKISVIGLTWGMKNSRDVVYAQKIAELYGWDWQHFELNSDTLLENIGVAAENGAIYSPVHLHAMPAISRLKGLDCVIAGSFGDSVGRAEYSGINVTDLTSTDKNIFNKFCMIDQQVFNENIKNTAEDLSGYHRLFPRSENFQLYELEKQIHYMRKQLNQCMSVINQNIPLYQAFSSPEVFGYVWSLDTSVRNDFIYHHILEQYSPEQLDIPWARTGVRYLGASSLMPDEFSQNYHLNGKWIREDLYEEIKQRVMSDNIDRLNVFNMDVLRKLLWLNSFDMSDSMSMIDEYLIYIASLSDFSSRYKLRGVPKNHKGLFDKIRRNITCVLHYAGYRAKHIF